MLNHVKIRADSPNLTLLMWLSPYLDELNREEILLGPRAHKPDNDVATYL